MSSISRIIKGTGIAILILGIIGSIGYAVAVNETLIWSQTSYIPFVYFLIGAFISFMIFILIYGFGALLEAVEVIQYKIEEMYEFSKSENQARIKERTEKDVDSLRAKLNVSKESPCICEMCNKHCDMVRRCEILDNDNLKSMMICNECFDKINNK